MKIEYNENERSIRIQDGAKSQYFLVRAMMILTFLNSMLFLYNLSANYFKMIGFIWMILGITSLVLGFYLFLKTSTAEEIALDNIVFLKEKNVLGRKRLSLKLKNGKRRNLITKNHSEITEAKTFFARHGIETNKRDNVNL